MRSRIVESLQTSAQVKMETAKRLEQEIWQAAEQMTQTIRQGGKLLFCGNGGSAADAQHLAAEFVVRFTYDRPALPALSLTTDSSIMTAAGNDFDFDQIFRRQVEALGKQADTLICISTSGNSPNVVQAAIAAKQTGICVIALTGHLGGELRHLADVLLNVPCETTARIQEVHITIGHILCELVQEHLRPEGEKR